VQIQEEGGGKPMTIKSIIIALLVGSFFLLALCILIHRCSKDGYSLKYQSKKRKIEIYPNPIDKSQNPKKTTFE
jgi:hypothetical protein